MAIKLAVTRIFCWVEDDDGDSNMRAKSIMKEMCDDKRLSYVMAEANPFGHCLSATAADEVTALEYIEKYPDVKWKVVKF